jgi:hypothetical protein
MYAERHRHVGCKDLQGALSTAAQARLGEVEADGKPHMLMHFHRTEERSTDGVFALCCRIEKVSD